MNKTWEELDAIDRMCERTIRIEHVIDDDGVIFSCYRGGKLLGMGIALHNEHGQADTIKRAIADLRGDCRKGW